MILLVTLDLMAGMPTLSVERASAWIGDVNKALRDWEIDTPRRAAAFLAQIAEECEEFREMRENLNYSAEGLVREWPTRFWMPDSHSTLLSIEQQAAKHPGKANALDYHRQPEKIANRVYANRMGNGDEKSGDGWRYRGGGALMLSGKDEFRDASIAIAGTDVLVTSPEKIETPQFAMPSAGWFWKTRNLNQFADRCDINGCTTRINGGTTGAKERADYYAAFSARLKRYDY